MIDPGIPPDFYTPEKPDARCFNPKAVIPFGVTTEHICRAMTEFTDFLEFLDLQLFTKKMPRFEDFLMPANFSSMVGEFMGANIPKYCNGVVKNAYHNGHPDLLPTGKYPKNSAQHAGSDGIEIKASRYGKSWQGHNEENVWLMVFVFESGRPTDVAKGIPSPKFRFLKVLGAMLRQSDWRFADRKKTSRRTITASVLPSGCEKMEANWIYRAPDLGREVQANLIALDADE
jgi:hypothetical protein